MSELFTYAQFGFRHIVDIDAMDHILFLVALAAVYRWRDARSVFWVITAFTVGHSITLALAVTGTVALPTPVIEFLIPVTIVLTGLANLASVVRSRSLGRAARSSRDDTQRPNLVILSEAKDLHFLAQYSRPLIAGLFGLVHGAGFANYLNALFVDDIAAPLLGFNVGIEIGQVVVLLTIALAFALIDRSIALTKLATDRWPALSLRVASVSLIVVTIGAAWAAERAPW